ncbi:S8 family serine peptidase [Actinomadura barringtoniae]|uniref:S8 family serine peptidase n=1 Tax=Actinomadura barringtoniae TaxID=1427535 RepID=A0A939PQI2_9ACTN|nr:S8 family serine peptidase [Actinomadura barringtoniae]MBO2454304.1 S8 family serine peptidase [Actinomadura barringtoniae]
MRWAAAVAVTGCLVPFAPALTAQPALAAPKGCQSQPEQVTELTQKQITDEPWPQKVLSINEAQSKATGKGISVAVVDSGVSTENPQLKGQVSGGADLTKTSTEDCVGHGTWVAGIIAAKKGMTPFYGVAPDAKIIPVKISNTADLNSADPISEGIEKAVSLNADVINVSAQFPEDTPRMRQAVENALAHGIPVVAAAGNIDKKNGQTPGPLYPAQYPGVISVGAIDQYGQLTDFSNGKGQVTVVAPGKDTLTTAPDGQWAVPKEGTSFATPYVAGVVALIKERYPKLTPQQVKQRIEATAEGNIGEGSGQGKVNPNAAVSAVLSPNAKPNAPAPITPVKIVMPERADSTTRNLSAIITLGALGLALVALAAGTLIPAGKRRGWRPGRVAISRDPDQN